MESSEVSGLELSERQGTVKTLVGGTLSSVEARALADFGGLTSEGEPGDIALLAVPFLDEGNRLLDAVTGRTLYKETIDRAETLIRAAQPPDAVA